MGTNVLNDRNGTTGYNLTRIIFGCEMKSME